MSRPREPEDPPPDCGCEFYECCGMCCTGNHREHQRIFDEAGQPTPVQQALEEMGDLQTEDPALSKHPFWVRFFED